MNTASAILLAIIILYILHLLGKSLRKQSNNVYHRDAFRLLHLAECNGWHKNPATGLWENRYEPMRFITAAMIEFSRENYDIKKPGEPGLN